MTTENIEKCKQILYDAERLAIDVARSASAPPAAHELKISVWKALDALAEIERFYGNSRP